MTTHIENSEKSEDSMSTATPTRAPYDDLPTDIGHTPAESRVGAGLFDPKHLVTSLPDAFRKLDPRVQVKSPVMFVVWVGSVLTTVFSFKDPGDWFGWTISAWLWATVVFANLAEAVAEGRGKAQADTLRKAKTDAVARRLVGEHEEQVPGTDLTIGDLVVCEAGDIIPGDGDVVEGVASVDESAITGESAPVIRESGGDRSAVTGGTKVLSDRIVIKITTKPGETFIDRMITLVEGAARQRTPNEIALNILLASLTIVFLLAVATLPPFADYAGAHLTMVVLIALLVCLIPTTIGALLSAIGIAGMDRLVQRNVLAMSGRSVEAAGDVSTLLLDKTGTITLGNRHAVEFVPVRGTTEAELADAAQLSSLADETPEGRSIVVLAKERHGLRERRQGQLAGAEWIAFTAQTRMSGVDVDGRKIRKGAAGSVIAWVAERGGTVTEEVQGAADRTSEEAQGPADRISEAAQAATDRTSAHAQEATDRTCAQAQEAADRISEAGGTPLLVAVEDDRGARILGVIHLKDVVKEGMRERFGELRRMGIKTVMITGDNPLTARAIAEEAGVDDFLAEATPEDKMALIKREQAGGKLVAMTGDGTNDAPALAQADVGVAMNTGTSAAKEAGNMVDLDSDPTKLIEIVEIGKQLLITRGALTTFSIANDVAKYFAIIPALFAAVHPGLDKLNIMGLSSPDSAILSAVIFNALIIVALVPLSLRGVRYRPVSADRMLRRNLTVYGLGGLLAPFVGIKIIDLFISLIPGIG
ncbi:potassium-transporting ATPase subunit KdpB [Streptomyces sp. NPDC001595]|uniref:potassium-transporting ATPase subunit KdpB n=1 Tax=Streptomyces sp. NPDC001532 TaxID=3154520 RepID=UPI003323EAF5